MNQTPKKAPSSTLRPFLKVIAATRSLLLVAILLILCLRWGSQSQRVQTGLEIALYIATGLSTLDLVTAIIFHGPKLYFGRDWINVLDFMIIALMIGSIVTEKVSSVKGVMSQTCGFLALRALRLFRSTSYSWYMGCLVKPLLICGVFFIVTLIPFSILGVKVFNLPFQESIDIFFSLATSQGPTKASYALFTAAALRLIVPAIFSGVMT